MYIYDWNWYASSSPHVFSQYFWVKKRERPYYSVCSLFKDNRDAQGINIKHTRYNSGAFFSVDAVDRTFIFTWAADNNSGYSLIVCCVIQWRKTGTNPRMKRQAAEPMASEDHPDWQSITNPVIIIIRVATEGTIIEAEKAVHLPDRLHLSRRRLPVPAGSSVKLGRHSLIISFKLWRRALSVRNTSASRIGWNWLQSWV